MTNKHLKRLLDRIDGGIDLVKVRRPYNELVSCILARRRTQFSKAENGRTDELMVETDVPSLSSKLIQIDGRKSDSGAGDYTSDEDTLSVRKWKLEVDWFSRVLEPALELCRSALTAGNSDKQKMPPSGRSLAEILSSLQKSKVGIQDWSLGDLAMGLCLIYLQQASADKVDDFKGVQILCDSTVQDLLYNTELAKGAYKENAAGLARQSMLRERNIFKFIKDSSVLRPGYYIGVDIRHRLVVLGIRGTHTVYDLITDMVSSSDDEITFEGFSTHFGTAEAARWLLRHEMETVRHCLEKYEGFRLRLVGHSLGGAAASLLAIMLRNMSEAELGFSPGIVSAVGIGTPPCVSKELAQGCVDFVSTVVLQDDVIPRLSTTSLMRLRSEILQTDWMTLLEKEDWKSFVELVTNAKQVVSSVQGVARKVADYAKFKGKTSTSEFLVEERSATTTRSPPVETSSKPSTTLKPEDKELFTPGTTYFIKRTVDLVNGSTCKANESYTLWKRSTGDHFQRIILSGNFISDHKCDNHYYALREVLKSLPSSAVR